MTTQTLRYIKIYNLNWVSSPELSQNTFIEFKIPKNFADADIEPKIFFYLELSWRLGILTSNILKVNHEYEKMTIREYFIREYLILKVIADE